MKYLKNSLFLVVFLLTSCESPLAQKYVDECGVINGDNSTCSDECGIPNGNNASIDECGNCDGQELVSVYLWGECYNIATTTELNLYSNNQITGEIPSEIGNLTNLETLNLSNTQITGEIPSEIGNLTNLTWLRLSSNNQLTGKIPSSIGNLTNLAQLHITTNQLSGEIPVEILNLNLTNLALFNNQFSGVLPEEICNIQSVAIGNNKFCPPYPDCIYQYQSDIDSQDTSNCP